MKNLLTLLSLTISISLHSQTDSIEKRKTKSQFGFIYSYEYGKKRLENGTLNGSSIGINWTNRIKHKFRFDIGMQFSNNSAKMVNLTFVNIDANIQSNLYSYTFSYDNSFLDIPIKFNYFLVQKKKINLYLIAGIYPTIFRHSVGKVIENKNTEGSELVLSNEIKSEKMIEASLFSTVGIGFEHKINQKFSLSFQAEMRNHFLNMNESYYDIRTRINGNLGIRYNL